MQVSRLQPKGQKQYLQCQIFPKLFVEVGTVGIQVAHFVTYGLDVGCIAPTQRLRIWQLSQAAYNVKGLRRSITQSTGDYVINFAQLIPIVIDHQVEPRRSRSMFVYSGEIEALCTDILQT